MTTATELHPTPRAARIAAIHALAVFYAAHPDVEAPTSVFAICRTTDLEEADEALRVAAVLRFAEHFEVEPWETPYNVSASFRLQMGPDFVVRIVREAKINSDQSRRYVK